MYSIWFKVPDTWGNMEVKVNDLDQAQKTWELLSKNFYMLSIKP